MKTETQPKHTAGPWKHHLGRGANPRFHIQTEGGYQIASTPELVRNPPSFEENVAKEANATLIAAAPDLLEALKALLPDGLECASNNSVTAGDQGSCGKCYDCKRYARAHLAIAAATKGAN